MVRKHSIHPLALFLGFALDAYAVCNQKKERSVRVGQHGCAYTVIMAITHPPVVDVTLGMHEHGVRTSTLSSLQKGVDVGRFLGHTHKHKDRVQQPNAMTRRSRPGVSMPLRVRMNDFLQRTLCNVGALVDGTITFGLVAFNLQMGRHVWLAFSVGTGTEHEQQWPMSPFLAGGK